MEPRPDAGGVHLGARRAASGAPVIMKHSFARLALAVSLATAVLVPVVIAADAPEWPRFRGPQGNPVSTGRLPDTWSTTENVEWKWRSAPPNRIPLSYAA